MASELTTLRTALEHHGYVLSYDRTGGLYRYSRFGVQAGFLPKDIQDEASAIKALIGK